MLGMVNMVMEIARRSGYGTNTKSESEGEGTVIELKVDGKNI